jgi:hypothetical protein
VKKYAEPEREQGRSDSQVLLGDYARAMVYGGGYASSFQRLAPTRASKLEPSIISEDGSGVGVGGPLGLKTVSLPELNSSNGPNEPSGSISELSGKATSVGPGHKSELEHIAPPAYPTSEVVGSAM